MAPSRLILCALALVGAASAAESMVAQAAARAEQKAALAPKPLAMEFRLQAAQALKDRDSALSRKLLDTTLTELRASKNLTLSASLLQALVETSPKDALAIVPALSLASSQTMVTILQRANHPEEALALFREISAKFAEPLEPAAAQWLALNAPPAVAIETYEHVIRAVSAPAYGKDAKDQLTATFRIGGTTLATDNTRDTLLLLAGSRLRAAAPARVEKYSETFAKWKLDGPATLTGLRSGTPAKASSVATEATTISQRMATMRSLPTDADRTRLTLELVRDIRALPMATQRFSLINSLSHVATEGDLGKEAMTGVATTLAAAMRDPLVTPGASDYIGLAKLARYEHLDVPSDASLDAALALLELREQIQQEKGFSVTGMDGKTYSLAGLKGRIVLLNFWATWCPPCRKEMPDMEKLYRAYEKKGLTVIAVSDEDRPTVEQFLAKNTYTFPVALDPGRQVNKAFSVDGIPKSFIFDREGRLAAQAIDMRTESQFMELLKLAGLE